jgi:hypothetical protein
VSSGKYLPRQFAAPLNDIYLSGSVMVKPSKHFGTVSVAASTNVAAVFLCYFETAHPGEKEVNV